MPSYNIERDHSLSTKSKGSKQHIKMGTFDPVESKSGKWADLHLKIRPKGSIFRGPNSRILNSSFYSTFLVTIVFSKNPESNQGKCSISCKSFWIVIKKGRYGLLIRISATRKIILIISQSNDPLHTTLADSHDFFLSCNV